MIKMVKEIDKNELSGSPSMNEPDLASPASCENEMPRIKAELGKLKVFRVSKLKPNDYFNLDCLNYANESINNLEIEFEESKREFLRTKSDFDNDLNLFEKKLGKKLRENKTHN